ncbi:uncharacterized protein CLUP02_07341 [Colletotrichum lupini]|uniref:Uncharacterized protein n=1 Tax=Colletotrichum lupini TaxID=145971 RepID=A0A9Q8SR34_9PEZI|nr:uncharacterized protein CLUP02_07341 [Colletotrichum lupini]UQC81855.1 hypothetical protein CLUP02_07341 [Colletotrichum lupini]
MNICFFLLRATSTCDLAHSRPPYADAALEKICANDHSHLGESPSCLSQPSIANAFHFLEHNLSSTHARHHRHLGPATGPEGIPRPYAVTDPPHHTPDIPEDWHVAHVHDGPLKWTRLHPNGRISFKRQKAWISHATGRTSNYFLTHPEDQNRFLIA